MKSCIIIAIGNDHHNVCQSLKDLSHQDLIELGGALGISYPKLVRMINLPAEMVAAWLNREDNVLQQSGEPTWGGLADALQKIRQTGIADDIRKSKCHNSSTANTKQGISGPSWSRSRPILIVLLHGVHLKFSVSCQYYTYCTP